MSVADSAVTLVLGELEGKHSSLNEIKRYTRPGKSNADVSYT